MVRVVPLQPLAWTLAHGAVIAATDELRRWGYQKCDGLAQIVKPRETLWWNHAPTPYPHCRQDLGLRLSGLA